MDFYDHIIWDVFVEYFHELDQDFDMLPDWFEVKYSLNPLQNDSDSNGINDANEDSDKDKLTNFDEYEYGANPLDKNTDNDIFSDYMEAKELFTKPFTKDSDYDGYLDGREKWIY